MAVQPAVAVGRGDALGLAPGEQRVDERVGTAQRLEPPGPGVGQVDADPARAGRAPGPGCAGRPPARPAGGTAPRRRGGLSPRRPPWRRPAAGRRARPTSAPAVCAVEGQAGAAQLDREQLGGRLRPGRESGQGGRARLPARVRQVGQLRGVPVGDLERGRRPGRRGGGSGWTGLRPVRPQVAVGAHRVPGLGRVVAAGPGRSGGQTEQVQLAGARPLAGRKAALPPPTPRPGPRRTRRAAAGASRPRPRTRSRAPPPRPVAGPRRRTTRPAAGPSRPPAGVRRRRPHPGTRRRLRHARSRHLPVPRPPRPATRARRRPPPAMPRRRRTPRGPAPGHPRRSGRQGQP